MGKGKRRGILREREWKGEERRREVRRDDGKGDERRELRGEMTGEERK